MAETRRISTLIETQIPEFISSDYENFSKVLEKYYEQLELRGQPLDVIQNITKYRDIDFYEKNLLKENTKLSSNVSASDTSISVEDATSFPEENGYIKIGDEILFYKERTSTQFLEVSRGVSGNTKLGDLYDKSNFVSTLAEDHIAGDNVQNISNLFLYAIVKNFESDYLASFPEKYLKSDVDKRTLIKNISSFYRAKGTDRSIKFIFNTLISNDKPEVVKPKDFTIKASTSDWITSYSLKVKVISGNPKTIIGKQIIQSLDPYNSSIGYASAVVDNVFSAGTIDGEQLYEIVLDTATLNNKFDISAKTVLTEPLLVSSNVGNRVNVFSTEGFKPKGRFVIGTEEFEYDTKNINQFVIKSRSGTQYYQSGVDVYSYSTVTCDNVKLLVLGVLYNLDPRVESPYSEEGDIIEISDPGFTTRNPIITDLQSNSTRWILGNSFAFSNNPVITTQIQELRSGVSGIYEDSNYYYVCSSSYPNRAILNSTTQATLSDQKTMRLLRKVPQITTESYPTTQRDVGIFVDGTLAFSNKDFEVIKFGNIVKTNITNKGSGYLDVPYVLINNQKGKARAKLSGETVDSIEILDQSNYTSDPTITITSGRGGLASATVTFGRITSIQVVNSGEYYSTPPQVIINDKLGKGRFAEYNAILDNDGKITGFQVVDEGKFYTKGEVIVTIVPVGSGATATSSIKTWTKNRYNNLQSQLDASNGYVFPNYNPVKGFGYGICANPVQLRNELGDNGTNHSPILGYAYDGNPIYGPYGFSNPLDASSSISRISSAYYLKSNRLGGPSTQEYPMGSFVEDYEWRPSTNIGKLELDENNGRFCVTPEYPEGVYAYFITVDSNNNPKFPYILGNNYYSLPVDSNYNADLSQDDLPLNVRRLRTDDISRNGDNTIIRVNNTSSGSVSSLEVLDSPSTFKVGNSFVVSDEGTEGFGAGAVVSEVYGKDVISLKSKSLDQSNNFEVSLVRLISPTYLFENDIITQENSDFTGRVIGQALNQSEFVIDQVTGTYKEGELLNSSSNIINIIISDNGVFTKGATLLLTDGEDDIIATGNILESTTNQNSIKVEVLSGEFSVPESANKNYFLQSTVLGDDVGLQVVTYSSLSKRLLPFSVNNNIALIETSTNHNIGVGSNVNIDINPDVSQTTTSYFVRKRFYQKITLSEPSFGSFLNDTGVGRVDLLNGGLGYQSQVYTDVELIFFDQSKVRNGIGSPGDPDNARATIVVNDFYGSGYGSVSLVTITNKGSNYIKGDVLTALDSSLNRNPLEISTQRLALNVDHVGFSQQNTELQLRQVNKLSENDLIKINDEILKVESINSTDRVVTVSRGQEGSIVRDHFNNARVTLYKGVYRFLENARPIGTNLNDPYIIDYNSETQEVTLAYNYDATNPRQVTNSTIFQDNSLPRKSVNISAIESGENKLEFSKDQNFGSYSTNADIRIQKYYRYVFDTSHFSMQGVFLDFSASKTGNIFTEEKEVSGIQPGNVGSYVAITLGFGPNISEQEQKKFPVNFDTYYYFIKASTDVNTENAALKVIDDPLSGPKKVVYTTENKFAYETDQTPEYQGTGEITYTTSSPFAEGKIYSALINNLGSGYKRSPIVDGCFVSDNNNPLLDVKIDTITGSILSVNILNPGKLFSKPKAIVTAGDGFGAKFQVYSQDGFIVKIVVLDGGKGYTYAPTVSVYETDIEAYFRSSTIGIPQGVSIISNGGSFHTDNSLKSTYRSHYALIVRDFDKNKQFYKSEKVEQRIGSTIVFSGYVSDKGWRIGSNILRLNKIEGSIDINLPIISTIDNTKTAKISDVLYTDYIPNIQSYSDNIGRYQSDKGKIGSKYQKVTDSYYYQDYSYVIQSKTAIDVWRDLIKQTTHPAGFQLFGEVLINSQQKAEMPLYQFPTTSITYIELPKQTITVESTTTRVTNSFVSLNDTNLIRGIGSISVDEYDTDGILSRELILQQEFNGRYATKQDYIGNVKTILETNTEITSAAGITLSTTNGFYKLYAVKAVSNNLQIPPNELYTESYQSVVNPGDIVINSGKGTVISDLYIGFVWDYSESLKVFGVLVSSLDVHPLQNFEVGDTFTYYQTATRYFKFEVTSVDAPAYDTLEGVIGNGNIIGRRTFQLLDKQSRLPYSPYNEQELFITINGVAQEPKKSFIVNGSTITFSEAPLGPLYPQTGENLDDTYETDPAKFVCNSFKFKEDIYNQRYLRKLKDISSQFNNISTEFDLYWEDGSIVKADPNERFLIFINGVLQRAKENSLIPLGNSYYINRRDSLSEPDQIIFSEPPRNFDDDILDVPAQLDQKEFFFGYGVGNYERLTIDENLIPYRGEGPYLLFGEVDGRVRSISEPEFCMVFVDGVYQPPSTYILNGPNILFSGMLTKYNPETGKPTFNKVDIISLYGRDVPKTLTFFDYDRHVFTNLIDVEVIGPESSLYEWTLAFDSRREKPLYLHSVDQNGGKVLIGKIERCSVDNIQRSNFISNSNNIKTFILTCTNPSNINFENLSYDSASDDYNIKNRPTDLFFSNNPEGSDVLSTLTNTNCNINIAYKTDSEGNRVLVRDIGFWMLGTELNNKAYNKRYSNLADILPNDKILVDGEKSYRTILSLPSEVKSRNTVRGGLAKYEHYSKIDVTNYNDITRGEGLSITTQISEGRVSELGFSDAEWNKRDLKLYFDTGILLQPTAYQYFVPPQVKFISVDGNGGGARAEILTIGGQILDVILLDGGSGYTQPPKAVVTRGYSVLRDRSRVISTENIIHASPYLNVNSVVATQSEIILAGEGDFATIFSIVVIGGYVGNQFDTQRQLTSQVYVFGENNNIVHNETYVKSAKVGLSNVLISENTVTQIENTFNVTIDVVPSAQLVENKSGSLLVDEITTIVHRELDYQTIYLREDSYSAIGAFLDGPISSTSGVVYVSNTSLFPENGKLQIGKEIVSYEGKLSDRFLNVVRGVDGTTATPHTGGQYIRTMPDAVIVLPAGPTTIITSFIDIQLSQEVARETFNSIGGGITNVNNVSLKKKEVDITSQVHVFGENNNIVHNETYVKSAKVGLSNVLISENTVTQIENTFNVIVDNVSPKKKEVDITSQVYVFGENNNLVHNETYVKSAKVGLSNVLISENTVTQIENTFNVIVDNVSPDLPTVNNKKKPADITLFREAGVIDYFEEYVVLETIIKLRN